MNPSYRLLTKDDFDGMTCGILLKKLGLAAETVFVHPKAIESGIFPVTGGDITAGLPYKEDAYLAFDHFASGKSAGNLVADPRAASTARVVYAHYGKEKFPGFHEDILDAADKSVSARLTTDDILYPEGWTLLSYLVDHRTGLEGRGTFRITHKELMNRLMDKGADLSVWELLSLPDVEERLELYFSRIEDHKGQILRCSSVFSNLVVTDTRREKAIYPGNKFVTYALFPECDVSLHVSPGAGGRTVFAAGKSVLDRRCSLDIGRIMKKYGGGGHSGAGACRAGNGAAEEVLLSLIGELRYGLLKNLFLGYFNYY
ncbi:MAG: exopolyphosphatase [Elusimicrobia bacterium]|nr:exopolyphosphatase [Elusimicrobiota bacterium]